MSDPARSLAQAKSLGLAGATLLLVSWIPAGGLIFVVVGGILLIMAVRRIANATGDNSIYRNMLYSIVSAIAASVVLTLSIFAGMFALFAAADPLTGFEDFSSITSLEEFSSLFAPALAIIIVGLVLVWVFFIVSAIFLRRSLESIGSKLGVGTFHTVSLLFLIGALLTIIVIGLPLIFISEIFLVIAFASIPDQLPQPSEP